MTSRSPSLRNLKAPSLVLASLLLATACASAPTRPPVSIGSGQPRVDPVTGEPLPADAAIASETGLEEFARGDGGLTPSGAEGKGPSFGIVAPVAGWNIGLHYARNDDSTQKIRSSELFANKEVFKNTFVYLEAGTWKTSKNLAVAKKSGSGYAGGLIFVF